MKRIRSKNRYGIRVQHGDDPTYGWLVDAKARVQLFASKAEAEKEKERRLSDSRYTWRNCTVEVCLYEEMEV